MVTVADQFIRELRPETCRLLAENLEVDKILYVIAIDQKGDVVVGWPGADTVDIYIQERSTGQQERSAGQSAEYEAGSDLSKTLGLKRFFTEDGRCLVGFHLPCCRDVLFCVR